MCCIYCLPTPLLQLYEEDAIVGHREFDLKLTQRVKMSMVGVPETSFNFWAAYVLHRPFAAVLPVADARLGNSWQKVRVNADLCASCAD